MWSQKCELFHVKYRSLWLGNIFFAEIKCPRIFYHVLTNFVQRGQIWSIRFASRCSYIVVQQKGDLYNSYALRVYIYEWSAIVCCFYLRSSLATSSLNIFWASAREEDIKKYTCISLRAGGRNLQSNYKVMFYVCVTYKASYFNWNKLFYF